VRALRVLGALLRYPDAELRAALPEIAAELSKCCELSAPTRAELAAWLRELGTQPGLDVEEQYVALFDRTRGLSLHLHEHVHGDARERGSAMVQLGQLYAQAGLELLPGELPDFLPVLCEFLSLRPDAESRPLLADAADVLRRLEQRLQQRESGYAAVLGALVELADPAEGLAATPDPDPTAAQLPDREALDAAWEETPVRFGPDEADAQPCGGGQRLHAITAPSASPTASPRSQRSH